MLYFFIARCYSATRPMMHRIDVLLSLGIAENRQIARDRWIDFDATRHAIETAVFRGPRRRVV